MDVAGNFAFVAASGAGLYVVNIANRSELEELKALNFDLNLTSVIPLKAWP